MIKSYCYKPKTEKYIYLFDICRIYLQNNTIICTADPQQSAGAF